MGRFYRTTSDTPVDYMSRLDVPLMEKVLGSTDQAITNSLNESDKDVQLANFNYLPQDADKATAIQKQYDDQATQISSNILSDPANWRRQLAPLRSLRQNLMDDYSSGAIGKYQGNYNTAKASNDAIDKQVQLYNTSGGKKGVSPDRAALAKSYTNSQFTGTNYDPTTKAYKAYNGISLMDDIDVNKRLSEGLEKLKGDGVISSDTDITKGGQYFNDQTKKWESVTPERVLGIISDRLRSDTGLMDYFKQNTQIGYSKGILDSNGQLVSPYTYNPVDISPQEQNQIDLYKDKLAKLPNGDKKTQLQNQLDSYSTSLGNRRQLQYNNDTPLAATLQGLVNQFSYSKTENDSKLRGNPVWTTQYTQGQENYRAGQALAQKQTQFDTQQKAIADRFKENMDWNKYKFDNPQAKIPGAKSTGAKTGTPAPAETTTSSLSTNSFEGITVPDANTRRPIPYLSDEGLSTSIDKTKTDLNTANSRIKDIDGTLNNSNLQLPYETFHSLNMEKQDLQRKVQQLNSNLSDTRNYYNISTNEALNKNPNAGTPLSDHDVALYKDFEDDRQGSKLDANIVSLRKQYPDIPDEIVSAGTGAVGLQTYKSSPEVQKALNLKSDYIIAKKRVDAARDTFLTNMRKTYISTDAIVPNEKEGEEVKNMWLNNPQGTSIFDENGDKLDGSLRKSDSHWDSDKGGPFNSSIGGDNDLIHYIQKYNVGVNIKQIGGTTSIGNGNAVLKVQFTDPNGQIPANKSYYISSSPEFQRDLSDKFSKHSNPAVAKIGKTIGDVEANSMRNQIASPDVTTLTGRDAPEKSIFVTLPNGTKAPLHITKLEGGHINAQYESQDGTLKPLPRIGGGVPGMFNGPEDLIEQWQAYKKLAQGQK